MSANFELRRIISQGLKFKTLCSPEYALNVVDSLVQKESAGILTDENKALYAQLKAEGFIG